MITRERIIEAVRAELDERAAQCREEHGAIGAAVADRLGLSDGLRDASRLEAGHVAPSSSDASLVDAGDASRSPARTRGRVWVFGRRIAFLPIAVAQRFDGVILATRTSRGAANRSPGWIEEALSRGVEIVGWDWMLAPGQWRPGLGEHVCWLKSVGARALTLNVEPRSPGTPEDWRGKHDELRAYADTSRELCDLHGLELWVTSWALPSSAPTFPWLELIQPAHRCIPQPYEVHGRTGAEYVARVIAEWRERGARTIILGRGAHELDKSDADAWRTPAEIAAHRASTPTGMDEAWWLPAGTPPQEVVEAILAP